jgi:hypothetical protein
MGPGTRIGLKRQNSLAVVLFQLGGPDSLEAVEPFLYNLFSDPDIFDLPMARVARPLLARMISSRRAAKAQHHYARIGGKSPIAENTRRQARALEDELRLEFDARVVVAMRYWHPFTEEAIAELAAIRVDVATVFDRVHNALKLSGNLYLAKLYTRTAERLGLRAWEESVASKLDVLHKMYDVFVHRVTTARAEALELTIIILIAVEIVLLLAGWGTTP